MKKKYPRTFHFPFSEGKSSDDKTLYDLSAFEGKEVVITLKLDGENSNLARDYIHARSLDSVHHPSRDWVKGLWGNIRYDIPENWRVCGENLYAQHSIAYDNLKSYFYCFNIWNEHDMCLSWDDTVEWCKLLNLEHVPVLYRGIFNIDLIKNIKLDYTKDEGFVCRIADSFHYDDFWKCICKNVRKSHVQTNSHWMHQQITPNKLISN